MYRIRATQGYRQGTSLLKHGENDAISRLREACGGECLRRGTAGMGRKAVIDRSRCIGFFGSANGATAHQLG